MGDSAGTDTALGLATMGMSAPFSAAMQSGGDGSGGPYPLIHTTDELGHPNITNTDTGQRTGYIKQTNPAGNVFDMYKQYLPDAMNHNDPIRDPSAIINAYRRYLPQVSSRDQTSNLDPSVVMPKFTPDQMGWSWQQWLNTFK